MRRIPTPTLWRRIIRNMVWAAPAMMKGVSLWVAPVSGHAMIAQTDIRAPIDSSITADILALLQTGDQGENATIGVLQTALHAKNLHGLFVQLSAKLQIAVRAKRNFAQKARFSTGIPPSDVCVTRFGQLNKNTCTVSNDLEVAILVSTPTPSDLLLR